MTVQAIKTGKIPMDHRPAMFLEAAMELPTAPSPASHAGVISLLGVDYPRLKTGNGGDLYLTRFGVPFREQLDPENWHGPDWFDARRTRLTGTSTIYKVPTQPVRGISLNLVVRFSCVGQEVPIDMLTRCKYVHTEFNSPFEEFALAMELRAARTGPSRPHISTKRPLAIYVPATRLQLWQTGRLESTIAAKLAQHPDVELDILRQYILLYGWIEGLNAAQASDTLGMTGNRRETFLTETTDHAMHDLEKHGFRMLDIKAKHIVLRFRPDGSLLRRRSGEPVYARVDYELLERFRETN